MRLFGWLRKKPDYSKYRKKPGKKLGLALGGGAARGIALIGVIRAFEELNIDFDCVAGTSVGSLFGALYADGWSSYDMERELSGIKEKDIRNSKFYITPSDTKYFFNTIIRCFGSDKHFDELKKKFVAVAVNLRTGNEVRISSGSVAKSITASSAIPGVFKPVVWDEKNLVDGGLVNSVPCDVVRAMNVDYVIAVDVNQTRGGGTDTLKTFGILNSAIGIMLKSNATKNLDQADYILFPNLREYRSTKLDDAKAMIEEGYKCVMKNKEKIIEILTEKPKKKGKVWQAPGEIEKI